MANNKTGFEYYNVDTDRYQDIRIKRLKKDFACAGIAVYDYILCEIYREKGCFLVWDDSTAFDVADFFGLKESLVKEIVNYCGVVGLFHKGLLTNGSIITSPSIQSRYVEMCKRAKRSFIKIPEEYNILPEEKREDMEEYNQIQVDSGKVKKSRVKESKEEKKGSGGKPPPPPGPKKTIEAKIEERISRSKEFANEIAAFKNHYSSDLLRSFYFYWSEPNKSGTKMKYEMEPTWNLERRLETWQRNEQRWQKRTGDTGATAMAVVSGPIPKELI